MDIDDRCVIKHRCTARRGDPSDIWWLSMLPSEGLHTTFCWLVKERKKKKRKTIKNKKTKIKREGGEETDTLLPFEFALYIDPMPSRFDLSSQ